MKFYIAPVLQFGLPCLFVSPNLTRPIKQKEIITQCTCYYNTPYTDYLIAVSGVKIKDCTIKSSQIQIVPFSNLPETGGYFIFDTENDRSLSLLREVLEDDGYALLSRFGDLSEFYRSVNTFSYSEDYDITLKYYWAHDLITDSELSDRISSLIFDTESFKSKFELNASKLGEYARLASILDEKEQQKFSLELKYADLDAQINALTSDEAELESEVLITTQQRAEKQKEIDTIKQSRMMLSKGIIDDSAEPIYDKVKDLYATQQ